MDFFAPALDYMNKNHLAVFPSQDFQKYLKENNIISNKRTQEVISIDNLSELASVSKRAIEENVMPLRLGSPKGSNTTHFTLIKVPSCLNDFFLQETEIFINEEQTFIPSSSMRNLFPFELIPTFTEGTLINLALESGLMHAALKLDPQTDISSVIIGYSSRFEFDFRPHSSLKEIIHHYPGQVEIDAAFLGKRNGKENLFIIEAKNYSVSNIAKHKLFYPVMSLISSKRIPKDIKIVPIYLKTQRKKHGWNFNIIECTFPEAIDGVYSLDLMIPIKESHTSLTLPLFYDKESR